MSAYLACLPLLNACLTAALVPLAIAILLSGADDLFLDVVCLFAWARARLSKSGIPPPSEKDFRQLPQKRIAIYVPCWKEHGVIATMVEHNVAAINYQSYDFFIGAYPNDAPTLDAARKLESRFPNVHLAVCAHDGPTSKADCLNWIYQRMLLFEESRNTHFDIVVTHDAEDLIHPDSLLRLNYYGDRYDFVQIPVFALPTPFYKMTHGVYCDELTEFQVRDMRARGLMGSFIPSSGVGTGYSRVALEKLAVAEGNRIFEPACLTEDYENGMRLHRLGCPQFFVPPAITQNGLLATREYFPQNRSAAIEQRTRWTMGIALQTWERHGWSGGVAQVYWFWRDRKGLVTNPVSLLANVMFLFGVVTWIGAQLTRTPWGLTQSCAHPKLLIATFSMFAIHTSVRMTCVSRYYGWVFALGVPLRSVWANYINGSATVIALFRFTRARMKRQPLVWVKTEHAYPSRTALFQHKRKLGEILAGLGYVEEADVEAALLQRPSGMRLGEHLVRIGKISYDDLYDALSLQQSVPAGKLRAAEINNKTARSLPRQVIQDRKVLPYRIADGNMFLASPEIPTDELSETLRDFTRMTLRFQLVTPANFEELTQALL
ncbi:MAG: glycosyl transferase family protein [Bryobacteraceae bacterium]